MSGFYIACARQQVAKFDPSSCLQARHVACAEPPCSFCLAVKGITVYITDFKRSLADKLAKDFFSEPSQVGGPFAQIISAFAVFVASNHCYWQDTSRRSIHAEHFLLLVHCLHSILLAAYSDTHPTLHSVLSSLGGRQLSEHLLPSYSCRSSASAMLTRTEGDPCSD